MTMFIVTYYNIEDDIERTKVVDSATQYEAMQIICNESFKNVILSIKKLNEKESIKETTYKVLHTEI